MDDANHAALVYDSNASGTSSPADESSMVDALTVKNGERLRPAACVDVHGISPFAS